MPNDSFDSGISTNNFQTHTSSNIKQEANVHENLDISSYSAIDNASNHNFSLNSTNFTRSNNLLELLG